MYHKSSLKVYSAAADPEFPRGGAKPKGGTPTYYFAKNFRKLHENEENCTEGFKMLLYRSATALTRAGFSSGGGLYFRRVPRRFAWYGAYWYKAFPLDMSQFSELFNTTRIPR